MLQYAPPDFSALSSVPCARAPQEAATESPWESPALISRVSVSRESERGVPSAAVWQTANLSLPPRSTFVCAWRQNASNSRITGVRTTVSFFTYNIDDGAFVPSPRRLSQTVIPDIGASWDYRHAEAGEYTKTSGVLSEAYGRGAEVWEVANVMMFLASDYSSYMTGEVVSVSSQRA